MKMSPPQQRNYPAQQEQSPQQQQSQLQVQVQNPTQEYRQAGAAPWTAVPSVPPTPIPLYPTGAAAIIPAPPTYEVIPNRIFVGGFPTTTTETDLREHFEKFYAVKDVKMVKSLDGTSKGYGFITFDTEDQAEAIRQLSPKQLEFRNRKLNLGPAIRKINASAFPPGYAIAASSSLVAGSPSPFSYAISPGPYGYQLSPATQMFVYPPVAEGPAEQQGTPQQSPTQHQPQQVFFGEQQEPIRTYANAVAGVDKSEPPMEDRQSPAPQAMQPLGNNNMMNVQYPVQQMQWYAGNNEQHQDMNNNSNSPVVYENHPDGQFYVPVINQMPFQQYAHNGANDKNGYPAPMYLNNNGMYQGYSYMASPMAQGTHAFPQLMRTPYYHPQQFRQQNQYAGQYNNNNWVGQDMHHQKAQHPGFYYQGPQFYQQQPHAGNDENSYPSPRPLQPPRAGKKNRKPSESQEKKNKSPTKGMRTDKNATPEKNQKKWNASNVSPLSTSLQSLAISSPTKN